MRAGLDIDDDLIQYVVKGKSADLMVLLGNFRLLQSSDIKDKVYALRGLISQQATSTLAESSKLQVDYRKPPNVVYLDAAWCQLYSIRNLKLLSDVQDQSRTQVLGLPSWVPDYSVICTPTSLADIKVDATSSTLGVCPWSATGELKWKCPTSLELSPSLGGRGDTM